MADPAGAAGAAGVVPPPPFVSFAQNFEDVMLRRALRDVEQGFYVDVGAYHPFTDSVTRAFYEAGWRGINLEPVEEYFRLFEGYRPRDVNLKLAAGEAVGIQPFYVVEGTGLSTLDAAEAERHARAGFAVTRLDVPVVTLAEVCRLHAPPGGDIHFLKLDCEGGERGALAGADWARFRPWIVLVEATRPTSEEESHGEWEPILLGADYRFVWFDGLNRFYVPAERHAALAPSFRAPPNVFDNFKLYETVAATAAAAKAVAEAATRPAPPVPALPPPDPFEEEKPAAVGVEERIAITARCRDADAVPKVPDAGTVRAEPDGTRAQVMHNGLKVPADGYYGEWMTRLIALCRGHHEPQEERAFHELLRHTPPDATMLELGGYWAYYSAWFLQGAPGRRAVVLEPDPAHRAVGERTMALNGLRAHWVDGVAGATPAGPAPFATETSGTLPLPRYSVPQLLGLHGIEVLHLLHCDAQGAELAVLEGCRGLFAESRIRWACVSTHAHQISGDPLTHQRCLALLREAGAEIEAEHDVQESFSGDGLILARFGPAPQGWEPIRLSHNRYGEGVFRNPAYDLARALRTAEQAGGGPGTGHVGARMPSAGQAGHVPSPALIDAAFRALLLRPADGVGLHGWGEMLARTGDVGTFLESVLRSSEFTASLPAFLAHYAPPPKADAAAGPGTAGGAPAP